MTIPSVAVPGWGSHRIEVKGVEVSFSIEDPGVQVCFEGELPEALCRRVVDEILASIERATQQSGRVVELS